MEPRRGGSCLAKGVILNVSGLGIEGLEDVVQIGTGGSSRVYRARQTALDRVVAVKVINASQDPGVARRFDRERKAMGRLSSHEGIVPVYSTGVTDNGEPFLVMPYYPDGSLQDQIDAGPVPWQIAARYIDVAAETISVAHGAGIVHLDIKPANILLTPSGAPRIADFGIAKLTSSTHTARTTGTAFTPAFSAPETFLDGKATPAADVYGLGASLWALLVGHPPFLAPGDDANLMAVIGRVVNNPTGQINHLAPSQICEVVHRAMEKKPEDRFASASDFSAALKQALVAEGQPTGATAPVQPVADSTQVFSTSSPVVSSARTAAPAPAPAFTGPSPSPAFVEPTPAPAFGGRPQGRSLLQNEEEAAPHVVSYREPVQRTSVVDFDRFRLGPLLVGVLALLGVGMLAAWALSQPGSDDAAAGGSAVPAAPSTSTSIDTTLPETSTNVQGASGFGDDATTDGQDATPTTTTTTSAAAAAPTTADTTTGQTTVSDGTTSTETTVDNETTSTTVDDETTTTDPDDPTTTEPNGEVEAPADVTAELDGRSVRLTWSPPATGPAPASYLVYRDGEPVANTVDLSYVDKNPKAGERSYRIGSVGTGTEAETVLSNAQRIVVPEPPAEEFAITAKVVRVNAAAITLEILGNECPTRLRISYMVTPEPGEAGVPLGPIVQQKLPCPGQPIRIDGLEPATSYDISVTAFNEDGDRSTFAFPDPVVTRP